MGYWREARSCCFVCIPDLYEDRGEELDVEGEAVGGRRIGAMSLKAQWVHYAM